jgi:hypothetical protein
VVDELDVVDNWTTLEVFHEFDVLIPPVPPLAPLPEVKVAEAPPFPGASLLLLQPRSATAADSKAAPRTTQTHCFILTYPSFW